MFLFFITGCICKEDISGRLEYANVLANKSDMVFKEVKTSFFTLTAYSRITDKKLPFNIYIEGDGFAWLGKHMISENPTPVAPLALELASVDKSANVIYIARPCQYTDLKKDKLCNSKYWSDYRFSKEVILSINQAINILLEPFENPLLNLIGYSGGGAIVTIIASVRKDINTIRTIGGNLDHVVFTKYHGVSSMSGSVNPADIAHKISNIPQNHFIGLEDKVVPKAVLDSFIEKSLKKQCIHSVLISNTTHTKGWKENWLNLLREPFYCK